MVLEKEAESLKTSRSRLADKIPYHNDDNNKLDINGKMILFPMEPNRGVGGMISSQNNNHQDLQFKPLNIEIPDVITQEAVWETAAAAAIQQPTTKAERPIRKEVARKKKLKEMDGVNPPNHQACIWFCRAMRNHRSKLSR